jgi:SOS-response transcriptional repressor LexA
MNSQNTDKDFRPGFDLSNYEKYQIQGFRDIRPINSQNQFDRFVGVPVDGDSLKKIGIFHGDLLIVKITDSYTKENLCVWETPHGRTAKFAYENFDEIVLHNKADWKRVWKAAEIKLLGVVVRIERDLEVIR